VRSDEEAPVTIPIDANTPPQHPYPASASGTPPNATGPAVGAVTEPAAGFDARGHVRRTRSGGAWVGLITAAVFLVLLIVFIAQNTARVSIKFLGFNGHLSLGLMILISATVGLLIASVPGTIRIVQLRRALRRNTPTGQRSGR
jgi:uncharacterized integral membrane protein